MNKYFSSIHKWQYLIHLRCLKISINSTYSWRYLNVAYSGDQWRLVTFPLNEHTLYCIIYWSFICSMTKCSSIPINGQVAGFIDINSSLTWSWLAFFMCGSEKLLFRISICLHTCFRHLGLSDVTIHRRWPEVYQNWVVFIDYYALSQS